MEENTVVTNVVEPTVPAVVEEAVQNVQAAIQPVVPPTIVVPQMNTQKTFLGLNERQIKDATVIGGISVTSILAFELGKKVVKSIPNVKRKAKEIWGVLTGDNKGQTNTSQPEPAPAPQNSAPQPANENPAPQVK